METIEVTNDGKVFLDGKEKKQWINSKGYYNVWLNKKNIKVHRLVALKYIPNPNNYPCVNHIDGNKLNNHYTNLEWVTIRMNNEHSRLTGLHYQAIGKKDLTLEQIKFIFNLYREGVNINRLSKQFNRDYKTIQKLIKGISYKDITEKLIYGL